MKKIFALLLTVVICSSLSLSVFAAEIKQDSVRQNAEVTLSATIEPTYTVTIPADATVTFNAETTSFGFIKVDAAQIEPDKCIKVSLDTDGELNNQTDVTKVIPYTVKAGSEVFTSATYLNAGDLTNLTINISKDDWNKAYAGEYKDTVTFKVEYINK